MRLHPPVSEEEALEWLRAQVVEAAKDQPPEEIEATLKIYAEAMAAVSAYEVPDDVEPLFP